MEPDWNRDNHRRYRRRPAGRRLPLALVGPERFAIDSPVLLSLIRGVWADLTLENDAKKPGKPGD